MVFILATTILLSVVSIPLIRTMKVMTVQLARVCLSKFVGALVRSLLPIPSIFSGFITIIVMGAVVDRPSLPVFSIIAEALVILCLDYHWWILPQLQEFYYFVYRSHLCSSKIVVDLRLFFFSLVHCFKYHQYSSQSIKGIHMLSGMHWYGNIDDLEQTSFQVSSVSHYVSMCFTIHYISRS